MKRYNIYCDESCHLEHDMSNVMTLGAIMCDDEKKSTFNNNFRELKKKHGINSYQEIKWVSVSNSKIDFYKELIDLFFDSDYLRLRVLIINNKYKLNHNAFNNDHNIWYYKMYYFLLNPFMKTDYSEYKLYIDLKDSYSQKYLDSLREIMISNFSYRPLIRILPINIVNSFEIELMEVVDIFTGLFSHMSRNLNYNKVNGKSILIDYFEEKSSKIGINIHSTTEYASEKINLLYWEPRNV